MSESELGGFNNSVWQILETGKFREWERSLAVVEGSHIGGTRGKSSKRHHLGHFIKLFQSRNEARLCILIINLVICIHCLKWFPSLRNICPSLESYWLPLSMLQFSIWKLKNKTWEYIIQPVREDYFSAQTRLYVFFQNLSVKSLVAQSCLTLCNPMDCNPPSYSVHRILKAGILEWVAIPFSRGGGIPSRPQDRTWVSCIAWRFFTVWVTREAP